MLTVLIIVSFLALAYFIVATLINRVAKEKLSSWEAGGKTSRRPEVVTIPAPAILRILASPCVIVTIFFWMFIINVGSQEVMVVKTPKGVNDTPLAAGWHFVLPWYETFPMDKTVWVYTFSNKKVEGNQPDEDAIWAPTSEGIKMGFDMSVSWRIDPEQAPWIYQNVSAADGGPNGRYKWIENNIVRAKTKSVFALTVSKFSPIECYSTGRVKIQAEVIKSLREEFSHLHLILDQVDIREVFYDPTYEAELKNKKVQEQKALTLLEVTKQKNEELVQARINKDIAIEQALGEAKSLQIKGSAINSNPKIIELEWINKWDGALPTYMVGGNSSMLLQLPGKK